MARINRSEITQKAIKDLRLDAARERMPLEASDKIVLTYPLNVRFSKVLASGVRTATGNASFYTVPSDRDFFLTNATLSTQSNVGADNTNIGLFATTDESAETAIISIAKISLTVHDATVTQSFNPAIKIKRGTTIRHGSAFTAGACSYASTIQGYEVEL